MANASSAAPAAIVRSVERLEKYRPVMNVPAMKTIPIASVPTAISVSVNENPCCRTLLFIVLAHCGEIKCPVYGLT